MLTEDAKQSVMAKLNFSIVTPVTYADLLLKIHFFLKINVENVVLLNMFVERFFAL